MKILTVIGARPQFIKAAAFSRKIENEENITEIIIHTGQHYDKNMSDIFFTEMQIPQPQYFLQSGGKTHGAMTGQQLEKIEEILILEQPDLVLVYGDTNSTLAGALAAAKLHIPVAHIEAGLRSNNKKMPEEINRVLTDHLSSYLFVPSTNAKENLIKEGHSEKGIFIVGDIMQDVALFYKEKMVQPTWFESLQLNSFILCTVHRAENTDNVTKLCNIFQGLASVKENIIMPLHPRTLKKIQEHKIKISNNIHIVEPVGYLEMVWLEANCNLIVTDSGGVQKEAYFHRKFCITLREETEWMELVEHGFNKIVGCDSEKLTNALNDFANTNLEICNLNIYGEGDTADKILTRLKEIAN